MSNIKIKKNLLSFCLASVTVGCSPQNDQFQEEYKEKQEAQAKQIEGSKRQVDARIIDQDELDGLEKAIDGKLSVAQNLNSSRNSDDLTERIRNKIDAITDRVGSVVARGEIKLAKEKVEKTVQEVTGIISTLNVDGALTDTEDIKDIEDIKSSAAKAIEEQRQKIEELKNKEDSKDIADWATTTIASIARIKDTVRKKAGAVYERAIARAEIKKTHETAKENISKLVLELIKQFEELSQQNSFFTRSESIEDKAVGDMENAITKAKKIMDESLNTARLTLAKKTFITSINRIRDKAEKDIHTAFYIAQMEEVEKKAIKQLINLFENLESFQATRSKAIARVKDEVKKVEEAMTKSEGLEALKSLDKEGRSRIDEIVDKAGAEGEAILNS